MSYCTKPKDLSTSRFANVRNADCRVIPLSDNVKIGAHPPVETTRCVVSEQGCTRLNQIAKGSGPYHNAFEEKYQNQNRGVVPPVGGPQMGSVNNSLLDRNLHEPMQIQRPHVLTACKKSYRSPLKMTDGGFVFGAVRDRQADEQACQDLILKLSSNQERSSVPPQANRYVSMKGRSTVTCDM